MAPVYLGAIPGWWCSKYAIYLPIRLWWFPTPLAQIKSHLIESFFYEGFMLTLVVGVVHAVEYQRSVREGQLRASQLENHLTRARLEILRNELQPHFLFNALNSISTLMHRNVDAADEMLAQLGDLLRLSLERKSLHEAPRARSSRCSNRISTSSAVRFGDRLSIGVDVDPALLDVTGPALHPPAAGGETPSAMASDRRAGAGRIDIRARAAGDSIEISVADDGAGLSQNGFREGIGLSNIRMRLEQLLRVRAAPSAEGESGIGDRGGGQDPARGEQMISAVIADDEPLARERSPDAPGGLSRSGSGRRGPAMGTRRWRRCASCSLLSSSSTCRCRRRRLQRPGEALSRGGRRPSSSSLLTTPSRSALSRSMR